MVQIPRRQVILAAVLPLLGVAYAWPNVIEADVTEEVPGRMPTQKSDLGLDLRGGSYLLMEVDLETALAERMDDIAAPLRRAGVKHSSGVQGGKFLIELRDPSEMERARELISNDVQSSVVSEDGTRIEIDVPEELRRDIQTRIMDQFLRNRGALTPSEIER